MTETDSQPIAENEQVKELLALLKDNNTPGYEEFAKLIEHVTGMEQRLFMTKPLCIAFFHPVRRKLRPSRQSLRACGMKITGSLPLHRRI